MYPVAVREQRSPLQRAFLHQWQADGYLLTSVGLILGVSAALGKMLVFQHLFWFCLVLVLPMVMTILALHRRRYQLAAEFSILSGGLYGLIGCYLLIALLPKLDVFVAHGTFLFIVSHLAVVLLLAGAATAGLSCGQALWDAVEGVQHAPGSKQFA
jgi:hypothetical protein